MWLRRLSNLFISAGIVCILMPLGITGCGSRTFAERHFGAFANMPVKGRLTLDLSGLSGFPSSMPVYSLKPIVQSKSRMRQLVKSFGITTGLKRTGQAPDCIYAAKQGDMECTFYWTEGFTFKDNAPRPSTADPASPPGLPSEEQATAMALKEARERDLLPDESYVESVSGAIAGSSGPGYFHEATMDRRVRITRRVGGYDLARSTAMAVTVTFAEIGTMILFSYSMLQPSPIAKKITISLDEAIRRAEAGDGTLNMKPDTKNPTITGAKLAYDSGYFTDHEYLVPIYVLSGKGTLIYVPATDFQLE